MNKKKISIYSIILLTILLLGGCLKEKDEIFPVIEFIIPTENSNFNVIDTLIVRANVSDETKLNHIWLYLTDQDYKAVSELVEIPVNSNSQHIYYELELSNKLLPSGKYYICIQASDEQNTKYKYQTINLNGTKKELLNIIIANQNSNSFDIYSLDTASLLEKKFTCNGNFSGFNFNSAYDQFQYWNLDENEFISLDYNSMEVLWSKKLASNPPEPNYIYSTIIDRTTFICSYEGVVEQFDFSGNRMSYFMVTQGYYIYKIYKTGNYFICFEKSKSISKNRISVYYASTKALKQFKTLDFEPISLASINTDEFVVVGKDGGSGEIQTYTLSNNSIQSFALQTIPPVFEIQKVNSNEFLISTESSIYWYRYQQNSLILHLENIYPKAIYFDDLHTQLFVLKSDELQSFIFPNTQVFSQKSLISNSKAFCFRYTI